MPAKWLLASAVGWVVERLGRVLFGDAGRQTYGKRRQGAEWGHVDRSMRIVDIYPSLFTFTHDHSTFRFR